MNITIQVDAITLATVVADVMDYDEDGELISSGKERTVAELVAEQIVDRLVKDNQWPSLREHVTNIRKEEIRAAVRPSIDEALTRPIYKTNGYGERTGAETTLAELIADEARKQLAEPVDRYRSEKGTVLQQAVRTEVKKAFETEIADAVKQARDLVTSELGAELKEKVTGAVVTALAAK